MTTRHDYRKVARPLTAAEQGRILHAIRHGIDQPSPTGLDVRITGVVAAIVATFDALMADHGDTFLGYRGDIKTWDYAIPQWQTKVILAECERLFPERHNAALLTWLNSGPASYD